MAGPERRERVKVVFNPTAAKGAAAALLPRLRERLAGLGLDHSVELTAAPWHAAEIARNAALEGFTVVAAAGGDGTANEVLNGLMDALGAGVPSSALAVLPIGRGNDFAFGLGLGGGLEVGLAAVATAQRRRLDVGRVTGLPPRPRHFGNGVGIGFDTIVGLEAARYRRLSGALGYAVAALKVLATFSGAPLLRVRIGSEEIAQRSALVSVMNGRRMGGAFFMAPAAVNDDGLLDLCLVDEPGRGAMLPLFARFMRGTQGSSRHVTVRRGRELTVEAVEGVLVAHADGETISTDGTSLRIECMAGAVETLSPPSP